MADSKDEKPATTKCYEVVNHAVGSRGIHPKAHGEVVMLAPKGGRAEVELTEQEYEMFSQHPDLRFRPAEEARKQREAEEKEAEKADKAAAAKAGKGK